MQLISPPMRVDDLINSRAALGQRLKEFSFLDRIELSNIEPFPWGFSLRPSLSPRFRQWWEKQEDITQHLWIDSAELDSFGSSCLLSRDPFGICAAICSWRDLTVATDYLRQKCIGPALWNAYKTSLLERVVDELARKFGLEQRPLNSNELPNYSDTKWGPLVQFKGEQVPELLSYLCYEPPKDLSLPILVRLGGNVCCVLSFGPESTRGGLCFNGYEDPAIVDLQGWLRSAHKSQRNSDRKETSHP
jgi:hypothetical protein